MSESQVQSPGRAEGGGPLYRQMYKLVQAGESADDAVASVLWPFVDEMADDLTQFVRWAALKEARHLEGRFANKKMRAAFGRGPRQLKQAAQLKIGEQVYKGLDGKRAVWDDLTLNDLDVKIAWFRQYDRQIHDHLLILQCAREVLVENDAGRLGDVEGWVALVDEKVIAARGEAVAA